MRYFKLFIISVVVFSIIFFCLSLLFPSTTYVSRAVNVKGRKIEVSKSLPLLFYTAFIEQKITTINVNSEKALKEYLSSEQMNYFPSTKYVSDTLLATVKSAAEIEQGVALHELGIDSTAVQVFYKIHVPWYKPWKKFALMLNESKYGPSLDSAISRIHRQF